MLNILNLIAPIYANKWQEDQFPGKGWQSCLLTAWLVPVLKEAPLLLR